MLLRVSTLAGVALAALAAAPLLPVAQAWGALGHYMVSGGEQYQAHKFCALHATMQPHVGAMLYRAGADALPFLRFSATCLRMLACGPYQTAEIAQQFLTPQSKNAVTNLLPEVGGDMGS
jgi:hypothetical protein